MKKTFFSIHQDNANHIHKKQAIHFFQNKIPPLARRCCFDSLMKTCKIIRQKNQESIGIAILKRNKLYGKKNKTNCTINKWG